MFGLLIKRYCTTCQEERQIHVGTGYAVDGKDYFIGYNCEVCCGDLCKQDRQILKKANAEGKDIAIVMH